MEWNCWLGGNISIYLSKMFNTEEFIYSISLFLDGKYSMSCQRAMSPAFSSLCPPPLQAHLYSYFSSSSDPAPAPPPPILLLLQCWQAGRLLIGQQQKPVPTRDESSKVEILFSVKCPKKFFLKYLFAIKWLDLFIFGIILLLPRLCTPLTSMAG